MNHSTITLGELLSHQNETIKRNAMSILKTLQKMKCIHSVCELDGTCKLCKKNAFIDEE